ncbi:DUF4258 domain-containing protein [bacterium]|nr:MAG: DUF4258 domain-containing protein [bacterium]
MPGEATADDVEIIRKRVRQEQFLLSKHATKRMDLRARTLADIRQVILSGEVVREYPDEKPYPEYLFLGYPRGRNDPCYVVVASNDETIIVTVHDYDPEVYEPDHRTRRRTQ